MPWWAAVSYLASFNERELKPKNILIMSLLAALLLFSRLDTIFIVVIMGIWLVFRKSTLRWQILLDGLFAFMAAIIAYFVRVQNTDNIFNFLPFFYIFIVLSLVTKVLCEYFTKGYVIDSTVPIKKQIIQSSLWHCLFHFDHRIGDFRAARWFACFPGFSTRSIIDRFWNFCSLSCRMAVVLYYLYACKEARISQRMVH